ncbi:DDE-type integrase/transposase/recombinase [Streptomyces anulatus]|uniref:DDE-type integrase/transposase/recombinase n=1 Tax=Streptomyces anulatus TaxID=1892 RepID=UPI0038691E51
MSLITGCGASSDLGYLHRQPVPLLGLLDGLAIPVGRERLHERHGISVPLPGQPAFSKGRHNNAREGLPLAHDDRVRRNFTPDGPNRLWCSYLTGHPTGESRLCLFAVGEVFAARFVGYSSSAQMQSRFAMDALEPAVARRSQVAGHAVHSDRGPQFRSPKCVAVLVRHVQCPRAESVDGHRSERSTTEHVKYLSASMLAGAG